MKLLELESRCPECGGIAVWVEQQITGRCQYCGSTLYFEPDMEHRFYLAPHVNTPLQARDVIIRWKAEQKRAEVQGRLRAVDDNSAVSITAWTPDLDLAPFVAEFSRLVSLVQASLIYVPYWHFQATLYQCLLAVSDRGVKEYCFRRTGVDQALPAYDQDQWNFRDRGLRFKEARLKEVTHELMATQTHLPFSFDRDAVFDRIASANVPVEAAADYLFKYNLLCDHRKIPVLRPYWIVTYACGGTETVLVDACFGTVAGHPGPDETVKLYKYHDKPLAAVNTPSLRVISSRCPECGADIAWSGSEKIHFCENCGRALILRAGDVQVQHYEYVPPPEQDHLLLPFWRFQLELKYRDKVYHSLQDYFRLFFAERLLKQRMFTDFLSVPAFKTRRIKKGDQLLAEFIASASSTGMNPAPGPLQPYRPIRSGHTDESAASEILRCALPSASGIPVALHKSGNLMQMLKQTTLNYSRVELIVLPYLVRGEEVVVNSKLFPIALLDEE